MLKQLGINLGAIPLRQLHRRPLDGERPAAHRRSAVSARSPDASASRQRAPRPGCCSLFNQGPSAGAAWATRAPTASGAPIRTIALLRAPGLGARRPRSHARRAEPDRGLGRDGQVPGRRRVSDPGVDSTARCPSPSRSSASASPSRRWCCRKAASASRSRPR